jgi:putative transcriptional regulator
MGERKLKIIDVARETGLHRNTVTLLYNETAARVDLEAIDKLCGFSASPSVNYSNACQMRTASPRPGEDVSPLNTRGPPILFTPRHHHGENRRKAVEGESKGRRDRTYSTFDNTSSPSIPPSRAASRDIDWASTGSN